MRIIVVLPAPLGPRKPKALPRGTRKSTLSMAARSPKRLVNPDVWIAGPAASRTALVIADETNY